MICCYEMSQSVEVVSNLRPRKNLGEGSTHGLSTLTFGRTFSLFTNSVNCGIFRTDMEREDILLFDSEVSWGRERRSKVVSRCVFQLLTTLLPQVSSIVLLRKVAESLHHPGSPFRGSQ